MHCQIQTIRNDFSAQAEVERSLILEALADRGPKRRDHHLLLEAYTKLAALTFALSHLDQVEAATPQPEDNQ